MSLVLIWMFLILSVINFTIVLIEYFRSNYVYKSYLPVILFGFCIILGVLLLTN